MHKSCFILSLFARFESCSGLKCVVLWVQSGPFALTPRVQFKTQIFERAKRAVRLRLRPALSVLESKRLRVTRFQSGDAVGVSCIFVTQVDGV
jgi:hypothetical protein